ncbi:MAG: hypothetical protein ACR2JW_18640 [Thermomicrobiales bacterium]
MDGLVGNRTTARMHGDRRRLLAVVVALAVAASACASASQPDVRTAADPGSTGAIGTATLPPTGGPVNLSIADVYRQVEAALDQPGMRYHATIQRNASTTTTIDPAGLGASTTEVWVDGHAGVARMDARRVRDGWTTIVTQQGQYTLATPNDDISTLPPLQCPGTTLPVAVVLGCPDAPFQTYAFARPNGAPQAGEAIPAVTIQPGQYAGHPIIFIVAEKRQQPYRSGLVSETRRLSLDPATYLPIAEDVERQSGGQTTEEHATYAHEFTAAALPADFFDPTALRRARPDPQGQLDQPPPGFPIYWLGAHFAGAGGVPPLDLWHVDRYNRVDKPWSSDQFTLDYTRADDPFGGPPVVRLTEYARAVWNTLPTSTYAPDGPCWTAEELILPQGQATLFLGYTWPGGVPPPPEACPADRSPDRFLAHVEIGDTVVVIAPWTWPGQTREEAEALVRTLSLRAAASPTG